MQETQVQSLGWEDPLEKEMATHSSVLAWRIPWTKEPGIGLQSMGSQRVGNYWATNTFTFAVPLPCGCPKCPLNPQYAGQVFSDPHIVSLLIPALAPHLSLGSLCLDMLLTLLGSDTHTGLSLHGAHCSLSVYILTSWLLPPLSTDALFTPTQVLASHPRVLPLSRCLLHSFWYDIILARPPPIVGLAHDLISLVRSPFCRNIFLTVLRV